MRILAMVVLAFAGCLATGCALTWQAKNGRMSGTWRPAIIFRTDTAILFNDGNEPLLAANLDFEAEGRTEEAEPEPEP